MLRWQESKLTAVFDHLPAALMYQPVVEIAEGLLPKGSAAVSNSGLAA
jgi:hypothetical protein